MKQYIITGDNNFWYSTFRADNNDRIEEELEDVKQRTAANEYEVDATPNVLYLYEAIEIRRVNLETLPEQ